MRTSPAVRRWLTGPASDPSVRARYWAEVEGRTSRDPKVRRATAEIGRSGWAARILELVAPDGHWTTPGTSARDLYRPKFIATNWHAIVLGDLGMTRSDPRIRKVASMLMGRWGGRGGDLSGSAGEICVTGNAVRTLIRFGYLDHPVVERSIDWILRTQKPDGGWHCFRSRTGTLDGWEGLAALATIPEPDRDDRVRRSIERGAEFFLSRRLMREGPRYAPWFRIHYPNHYYYDLLVGLRILTQLGFGSYPRLAPALEWLRSKRRPDGTWSLDAAHPDIDPKMAGFQYTEIMYPMMLEQLHDPSRWATVSALAVLARTDRG